MPEQPLTEPTGLRGIYWLERAQAKDKTGPLRTVTYGYQVAPAFGRADDAAGRERLSRARAALALRSPRGPR